MATLFFWMSKCAWLVLSPDSLLLILLIAVWGLLWRGKHKRAKRWLGWVMMVILVIALFPVDEWVMYPLEKRFPTNPKLPDQVAGIIVLGGAEDPVRSGYWDQAEMGESTERILTFMALAKRFPQAKLIYSGGSGSLVNQGYSGSTTVQRLFQEQGMNLSRVTLERHARNTFENARNSKALAAPDPNETWILITSAWHMPRAVGVFHQVHWKVIPYPVDHWTNPGHLFRLDLDFAGHLNKLTIGTKEWVGLLAYFVTRKTSTLFPSTLG